MFIFYRKRFNSDKAWKPKINTDYPLEISIGGLILFGDEDFSYCLTKKEFKILRSIIKNKSLAILHFNSNDIESNFLSQWKFIIKIILKNDNVKLRKTLYSGYNKYEN